MTRYVDGPVGNDPVMPAAVATVHGEALTVRLSGDIDTFTAPTVLAPAGDIITTGVVRDVVVDLADVTFMDAGAVRALTGLAMAAADRGGSLYLRDARPHIRWLCQQVGAAELLVDPSRR